MKQFWKKRISSFLVVVMMMSLFMGIPQKVYASSIVYDWTAITAPDYAIVLGMAVDSHGNLYLADQGKYTITKIDSNGAASTVTPPPVGNTYRPYGIAVDNRDNIYVTFSDNTVQKYDGTTWTDLTYGATFTRPYGIAVDGSGDHVYVTDKNGNTVYMLSGGTWTDIADAGAGSFPSPKGIAVDSFGDVYVCLNTIGQIKKLSGGSWSDISGGSFNSPTGIAIDSSDNVYVSDADGFVKMLPSSGGLWSDIDGDSAFRYLNGIAVDSSGNVYVADDSGNQAVYISKSSLVETYTVTYDSQGGSSVSDQTEIRSGREISAPDDPTKTGYLFEGWYKEATFDNLWDFENDQVTADTTLYAKWSSTSYDKTYTIDTVAGTGQFSMNGDDPAMPSPLPGTATLTNLYDPQGVAVDSQRKKYITDDDLNVIFKIDTDGTISRFAGSPTGASGVAVTGQAVDVLLNYPTSITIDQNDNLYFIDKRNDVIRKIDTSGTITTVAGPFDTMFNRVYDRGLGGLAVDKNGNMYVSDKDSCNIYQLDAGTGALKGTVASGFSYEKIPIALDGDGNLYIADLAKNQIQQASQIDDGSWVVTPFAGNGTYASTPLGDGGLATDAVVQNPCGVTVDSAGNVYILDGTIVRIVDANTHKIYSIAGNGDYQYNSAQDGGLALDAALSVSRVGGMTVDSRGNVYIADQDNALLRKLSPVQEIFTVSYDSQGGSTVSGTTATDGEKITTPTAPTRSGYTFGGWFKENECTNAWNFSTDTVTVNVTLYAKWTAASSGEGPSSGGSSSGGSPSNTETITVDVKEGNTDDVASQISIKRTTNSNGQKTDTVNYEIEKATETMKQLQAAGKDIARIVIPDAEDKVSETIVTIPSGSIDILSDGKVNLQIDTEEAKISIAKTTLEDISTASDEDLYFHLVPVKDTVQKETTANRAMTVAIQLSGNEDSTVSIVGNPITIETNMSSRAADITLPLKGVTIPTDPTQRVAFLEQLGVYIEHSDGTKELVQGQLVDYGNGIYGVSFHIEKFSTFTVVKTDAFLKSKDCSLIKVTLPTGAVIKGKAVNATVTNATHNLIVKAQVSDKATWKLYTDKSCIKVVKDNKVSLDAGSNVFYIKVTAEDGKTSKIYKLTISREKPELQTGFNPLRLRAEGNTNSQKLSYTKVSEADGYVIYGAPCGIDNHLVRIAEVSANTLSYNVKELKADTYYKYVVKAYQLINGKKVVVAISNMVHTTTTSKINADAAKVTVNAATLTLKANTTKQFNCKVVIPSGKKSEEHIAEVSYESSNTGIASVSSTGKVKAIAKGTCYIYAYAENGVYNKVKVTVK